MTHGGKREGGGRKTGTRSRASVEREKRVAASGATPLEIMLEMMRESYADVQSLARRLKAITGRGNDQAREELQAILRRARIDTQAFARDAAPYVHPKLQSVLHGEDPNLPTRVVHDLSEETMRRARAIIFDG